jgi:hypothetical protein
LTQVPIHLLKMGVLGTSGKETDRSVLVELLKYISKKLQQIKNH